MSGPHNQGPPQISHYAQAPPGYGQPVPAVQHQPYQNQGGPQQTFANHQLGAFAPTYPQHTGGVAQAQGGPQQTFANHQLGAFAPIYPQHTGGVSQAPNMWNQHTGGFWNHHTGGVGQSANMGNQHTSGVAQAPNMWNQHSGGFWNQHTGVVAQAARMGNQQVGNQHKGGVAQAANMGNQQPGFWYQPPVIRVPHASPTEPTQGAGGLFKTLTPRRCVYPKPGASKITTLRIKMDDILRESNTDFMFLSPEVKGESRDGYVYYDFPSLEAAQAAHNRYNNSEDGNLFDIRVDVDKASDTPTRNRIAAVQANTSAVKQPMSDTGSMDRKRRNEATAAHQVVQGNEKRPKLMQKPLVISMHPAAFRWQYVKDFAKRGNSLVLPYKFDLATTYGSVSPDVSMCWCTPVGGSLFSGLLGYMGDSFNAGLCWSGPLTLENLMVSSNLMCAVVPFPTETASDEKIRLNISSLVSSLIGLYTLNGQVPPFFEDLVLLANSVPSNISSNSKVREQFILELVNHMSFWPEDKIVSFLQEFHILFKNAESQDKTDLHTDGTKTIPVTDWLKPTKTDLLLEKVLKGSFKDLKKTLGNKAAYLRHFGVHVNDHVYDTVKELRELLLADKPWVDYKQREMDVETIAADNPQPIFTARERVMVIAYYFKNFLAKFSTFLLRLMEKKRWIKELCSPFIKKPFEIGAAPLGSIILEGGSDTAWHTLFKSLPGVGPAEVIVYLKTVIRALWYLQKFRDDLTRTVVLHKSSHQPGDDISCALCALNKSFTSLSNGAEEEPKASLLLNILVQAYSENKDLLKGGRNGYAELLDVIYKCLHMSSPNCRSNDCLAHRSFGLDSIESFTCGCGHSCVKKTSDRFIHYGTTTSLRMQTSKHFGDSLSTSCEKCKENNMVSQGHTTICSPKFFTIVLESSGDEISDEIFGTISTEIDISSIYSGQKKTNHLLMSVICQGDEQENHYVCFALDNNRWILHDKNVTEVGGWNDIVSMCKERRLRPQVLLFGDAK